MPKPITYGATLAALRGLGKAVTFPEAMTHLRDTGQRLRLSCGGFGKTWDYRVLCGGQYVAEVSFDGSLWLAVFHTGHPALINTARFDDADSLVEYLRQFERQDGCN